MPQEALSQSDIDRMLREMSGAAEPASDVVVGAGAADSPLAPAAPRAPTPAPEIAAKRLRGYDFRRPNRISKEIMRGLRMIFETFGRDMPRALGPLLRAGCQVKMSSMEQTIYDEFRNHLAPHAFICTATLPPLEGEIAFLLDLDAAYIVVDRLLGGPGTGLKHTRELTSLELNLLQRTITALLPNWREAWLPVINLEPIIARGLSSTEFLQLTSANESVVVVAYELKFLHAEIEITICLPYSTLEPILTRVVAGENIGGHHGNDDLDRRRLTSHLTHTNLAVSARLGAAPIPIVELARLTVGDIIRLDVPTDGLAALHVGPYPYFNVRPGLFNGGLAVQVVDIVRPYD